ncbi:hypothetical protein BWI17_22280 [Betaproteobacteria bacterium GR16-43]|nr:hypothetical protein BWI17_22280 [Betaproteobacteria bacterium GR16-43]
MRRLALAALAVALPAAGGGMSSELLLSSAWCTFTYNKVSGYSSTKRVTFAPNGVWSQGARTEGGSSNQYGSVYGQRDSRAGGAWRVHQGELFMSEGAGQLGPVATVLKRNSNGYPIIVADGIEYSQCR